MAYSDMVGMAQDPDLRSRCYACAAEQGKQNPQMWVDQRVWQLASTAGWAAKWASAVASSVPRPGWDPSVITDSDLLARIQPML